MFRPALSLAAAMALVFIAAPAYAQTATAAAPQASAQDNSVERYSFDKPHTQILFSIDHLGFTKSHGRFLDYDGTLVLDRKDPSKSSVEATIKTDSLDMGDGKWDEHLKSPDFFNVAKFPTMTFKSTKVVLTDANDADVTGDLTILGVTKPVVLKVRHNKSGPFPMKQDMYVAGFTATTSFKRSDFGMDKYLPMLGDQVDITIELQGDRMANR